jgi:hypothetical protein
MFHEGDLQSGIASAVQQSKALFCFIHGPSEISQPASTLTDPSADEEENSKAWESTILKDEHVRLHAKLIIHSD